MNLFNQHSKTEAQRKQDELRQRKEDELRAVRHAERERANREAKKKKLKKNKDDDDEYVPMSEDEDDDDEYETEDGTEEGTEEGFVPTKTQLVAQYQQTKAPPGFNMSCVVNAQWTAQEVYALISYATENAGDWNNVGNDATLKIRHNDPNECKQRFQEIMGLMGSYVMFKKKILFFLFYFFLRLVISFVM